MQPHLEKQWERAQKDLAQKVLEAERIADHLFELARRLRQEPWKWTIGWLETSFPDSDETYLIEPEMGEALDRHRLQWLLDDIRILRRREAELKKLLAA